MQKLSLLKELPQVYKKGFPFDEETSLDIYQKHINYPKITVITPSYNQGQYLEETIRSVLLQNYPNLEYFIIDGGSTDNSVEIIKKYEKYITYWLSEKDRGQSHAIQKGLDKATGEICNWLNSDDCYTKNTLSIIAHTFLENKNTLVVSGYEEDIDEIFPNKVRIRYGTRVYNTIEETFAMSGIAQPSTFFKIEVFKRFGINPNLAYTMDQELWKKFILGYGIKNIIKIPEVLIKFRRHEESKTISAVDSFTYERQGIAVSICKQAEIPNFIISYIYPKKYLDYSYKWDFRLCNIRKLKHVILYRVSKEYIWQNHRLRAIPLLLLDIFTYFKRESVKMLVFDVFLYQVVTLKNKIKPQNKKNKEVVIPNNSSKEIEYSGF